MTYYKDCSGFEIQLCLSLSLWIPNSNDHLGQFNEYIIDINSDILEL